MDTIEPTTALVRVESGAIVSVFDAAFDIVTTLLRSEFASVYVVPFCALIVGLVLGAATQERVPLVVDERT